MKTKKPLMVKAFVIQHISTGDISDKMFKTEDDALLELGKLPGYAYRIIKVAICQMPLKKSNSGKQSKESKGK